MIFWQNNKNDVIGMIVPLIFGFSPVAEFTIIKKSVFIGVNPWLKYFLASQHRHTKIVQNLG